MGKVDFSRACTVYKAWALYHGERAGIKLHVSFTPLTGMPFKVVETTGLVHDGPIDWRSEMALILQKIKRYQGTNLSNFG